MLKQKIVFQGKTEKGLEIKIRYPQKNDAGILCEFINILSKEKTFIRFQGEEITLKEEKQYLNSQLEKIVKKKAVQLLVFCEEKLAGVSDIGLLEKAESHVGVFGIVIAKEYRHAGVGKALLKTILKEAANNIDGLKIITLGVFGNNVIAKNMYLKFGFKEYGSLPGGVKHRDQYIDHILLYKNTG